jgi:tripartite-type tricarboxylate transporter receptor subunit TctC
VPTIAEAGLPDYEYVAWFGVFAPGTTRPELVARISALLRNAVDSPDTRERLRIQGKQLAHTRKERFALISPRRLQRYAGAMATYFW